MPIVLENDSQVSSATEYLCVKFCNDWLTFVEMAPIKLPICA